MISLGTKASIIFNLIIAATFFSCEDSTLSPEEVLEDITISPNPFSDSLLIEINGEAGGDVDYQIISTIGSTVLSERFLIDSKKNYVKTIDLKELEVGIYMIRIEYRKSHIFRKIVKQDSVGE